METISRLDFMRRMSTLRICYPKKYWEKSKQFDEFGMTCRVWYHKVAIRFDQEAINKAFEDLYVAELGRFPNLSDFLAAAKNHQGRARLTTNKQPYRPEDAPSEEIVPEDTNGREEWILSAESKGEALRRKWVCETKDSDPSEATPPQLIKKRLQELREILGIRLVGEGD